MLVKKVLAFFCARFSRSDLEFSSECKINNWPAIDNGFYYDLSLEDVISKRILKKLKMFLEFTAEKHKFSMRSVSKADALSLYKKENNPYKVELIENLN
jgi:threonyl-tRNA synthetase